MSAYFQSAWVITGNTTDHYIMLLKLFAPINYIINYTISKYLLLK